MNLIAESPPLAVSATQQLSFAGVLRSEVYKALRMRVTRLGAPLAFVPAAFLLLYSLVSTFIRDNLAHGGGGVFLEQLFEENLALIRAFSGVFLIVLTVQLFGQEFQNGTIRIILARGVDRVQLVVAKLLAVGLIALGTLAAYLAVMFPLAALAIIHTGGMSLLTQLPATFGGDMLRYVLSMLFSVVATVTMAMAATIVGRSLVFGMGVALVFFPVDANVLTAILGSIAVVTKNLAWAQATAYLLGPTLNAMPLALLTGERIATPVLTVGNVPLVMYDGTHDILVVLGYIVAFVALSLWLMRQRDVQE